MQTLQHLCLALSVGLLSASGCANTGGGVEENGCDTRITGIVTAPNGIDPVPGATVYYTTSPPEPFSAEIRCEPCVGAPAAQLTARSGADGTFTLRGLPMEGGTHNLVVQKGRFRRSFQVTTSTCRETNLAKGTARLPRNRREGDLPSIAVAVGDFDSIECVLRHIGIDGEEFTAPFGGGAIHLYENEHRKKGGAPGNIPIDKLLLDQKALFRYQVLALNCTDLLGVEPLVRDGIIMKNLLAYVQGGGRLYATDWAYNFIAQQSAWAGTLCFEDGLPCTSAGARALQGAAMGAPGQIIGQVPDDTGKGPVPLPVRGLREFLLQPQFGLPQGRVQIRDLLVNWALMRDPLPGEVPPPNLTYLRGFASGANRPLTATFDYPRERACGRVLYSSYHTRGHLTPGALFPAYCPPDLVPQERVLEYLLFEVSTCVPPPG